MTRKQYWAIVAELSEQFRGRTRDYIVRELEDHDLLCSPEKQLAVLAHTENRNALYLENGITTFGCASDALVVMAGFALIADVMANKQAIVQARNRSN